jgi:hypothetical protein
MPLALEQACPYRSFLRVTKLRFEASAGVRDGHLKTPYDLAVTKGLSVSFIRLSLNADVTIDPVQRSNLNYAARREGFRALCYFIRLVFNYSPHLRCQYLYPMPLAPGQAYPYEASAGVKDGYLKTPYDWAVSYTL